jgi:hypothetical protein
MEKSIRYDDRSGTVRLWLRGSATWKTDAQRMGSRRRWKHTCGVSFSSGGRVREPFR